MRTQATLCGDGGNFATTVSARKLIDILRSLPNDQVVTLAATPGTLLAGICVRLYDKDVHIILIGSARPDLTEEDGRVLQDQQLEPEYLLGGAVGRCSRWQQR